MGRPTVSNTYQALCMCRRSVLDRSEEVFYRNKYLKPYVFFDVEEGRDFKSQDGANSGSRRNQVRLLALLHIYIVLRSPMRLRSVKRSASSGPRLSIRLASGHGMLSQLDNSICHSLDIPVQQWGSYKCCSTAATPFWAKLWVEGVSLLLSVCVCSFSKNPDIIRTSLWVCSPTLFHLESVLILLLKVVVQTVLLWQACIIWIIQCCTLCSSLSRWLTWSSKVCL